MDPEAILAALNDEQREAARATTGPVVILAGAGTGKTRVISHRAAYAAATGAIDPKRALVVTFTEKAATEMRHRLDQLGLPQVQASTFHAAARRQLAYHWPLVHGRELPDVLDTKLRIIGPLARQLPGGYRFTPARDLADEIEWAKVRRMRPDTYAPEREPPVRADIFVDLWRGYEAAKARRNVIDFEDMLSLAVELYESDEQAIGLVRQRYAWFSVDEYQDTNRLQEDLLHLWLGDRRDLCVVGDPDQTIYTFTGASSQHLVTFAQRHADARVIRLRQNYRSTPQVIDLANRLIPGRELAAVGEPGPAAELVPHASDDAEEAAVVARIRQLIADGVPSREMAILVRTNAQLVGWESALTAAGIGFTIRGLRFFARPDVRAARATLRAGTSGTPARVAATTWRRELGFDEADPPGGASGAEARDRHAALSTLLAMARELQRERPERERGRLPGRPGATRRRRGGGRRHRRHALHPAPRQGPGVGRRLPAISRGGHPADPPGQRRRRAGRGAAPPVCRDHARSSPSRPVVGRAAGRLARHGGPRPSVTLHRRAAPRRAGSATNGHRGLAQPQ